MYPRFPVKRLTGRWELLGEICSEGVGPSNEGGIRVLLGEEKLDLTLFPCKSACGRDPLGISIRGHRVVKQGTGERNIIEKIWTRSVERGRRYEALLTRVPQKSGYLNG